MFDIHSHIIYHIDDGSHDLEESLELIRQDVEQGAHAIIATPHYYVQYPTDPARIRAKLATIEEALGIGEQATAQPTPGSSQTIDAATAQPTLGSTESTAHPTPGSTESAAQPTLGSTESAAQPTPGSSQTTDATTAQPTPSASEANASDLDVHLYAGNEVLWFDSMTERLQSGEILTLADSHYTLIEFYPEESYQTILRAIRNVRNAGYRPIIAHAERFKAIQEHGLAEVRDLGAYVQLSTEPLSHKGLSGLFDRETKFIQKALRNQEADFLGTDMHRTDRRPPVLRDAIDWIQKSLDADYADAVLQGNAEAILQDEELY